jgi:hypothetical protein
MLDRQLSAGNPLTPNPFCFPIGCSTPKGLLSLAQAASLRFDTETQTINIKIGESASSGLFYIWDPNEVQRDRDGALSQVSMAHI